MLSLSAQVIGFGDDQVYEPAPWFAKEAESSGAVVDSITRVASHKRWFVGRYNSDAQLGQGISDAPNFESGLHFGPYRVNAYDVLTEGAGRTMCSGCPMRSSCASLGKIPYLPVPAVEEVGTAAPVTIVDAQVGISGADENA